MEPYDVAFMKDTPLDVQRKYFAMLASLDPNKRFAQGMRLTQMARVQFLDNIQRANPQWTTAEVKREYLRQIMEPEQFRIFFPE